MKKNTHTHTMATFKCTLSSSEKEKFFIFSFIAKTDARRVVEAPFSFVAAVRYMEDDISSAKKRGEKESNFFIGSQPLHLQSNVKIPASLLFYFEKQGYKIEMRTEKIPCFECKRLQEEGNVENPHCCGDCPIVLDYPAFYILW